MDAKNSIFYHIYPLGFCQNEGIKKITNSISHIKYVGANALYLGPVFESKEHGYDTSDYFKIDKRLGTNEEFKEVCENLHANNISIVLDGVFNHVGREFWAFKDVQQNKTNSKFRDWFYINWENNNKYNDGFCYEGWEGCDDIIKLNLSNQDLKNHIFSAIKFWIDEFKIDGLRLDVAYCLDKNFLKELHQFVKKINSEFWLMGETLHGDYNQWMNENMLDSVTNYVCYKGLYSSCNDINMFEINYSLNEQKSLYKDKFMYTFVDNHDVTRIASILKDKRDLKLVYTLLFCMPGIPSIYYGSEFNIEGDKEKYGDKVLRPNIQLFGNELTNYISKLSVLRKKYKSLVYGEYNKLELTNEVLVFSRKYQGEEIICAINVGSKKYKYNDITLEAKSAHIFKDNQCLLWIIE